MDIKARQENTTPATWDAGEMVFVDGGNGTAAMYVTSASGVPRQIVGPGDTVELLSALPATPTPGRAYAVQQADGLVAYYVTDAGGTPRRVTGPAVTAPPPTTVTRTGAVTPRLTLSNVDYVQQVVTPSVNVPLTALVLEQATAQGSVALMILDQSTNTTLPVVALTQVGADLRAALDVTLIAGRPYRLTFGKVGNATGKLASAVISQGHVWTGVTPAHQVSYWNGFSTVLDGDTAPPLPQLPLQYVTGDMSGVDPSGITVRGRVPVNVTYDQPTRTYTIGMDAEQARWAGRWWARGPDFWVVDDTLPPIRRGQYTALDFTDEVVGGAQNGFNAVFEAFVTPKYSEAYTLQYWADNGIRVYLDGVLILDRWGSTQAEAATTYMTVPATVSLGALTAGRSYAVRVEWCQEPGGIGNVSRLRLQWQSASQPLTLLTAAAGPSVAAAGGGGGGSPGGGPLLSVAAVGSPPGSYQGIPVGAWTPLVFNTIVSPGPGGWNTGNGTFTVPLGAGGTYLITLAAQLNVPAGTEYYVALWRNGQRVTDAVHATPGTSGYDGGSASDMLTLLEGDTLVVQVYLTSAGTLVGDAFRSFLKLWRLG